MRKACDGLNRRFEGRAFFALEIVPIVWGSAQNPRGYALRYLVICVRGAPGEPPTADWMRRGLDGIELQTTSQAMERVVTTIVKRDGGLLGITLTAVINSRTPAKIEVTSIEAGSPTEAAGLHVGDVLVEIEGRPAPQTAKECTALLKAAGAQCTVTVERSKKSTDQAFVGNEQPPAAAATTSQPEYIEANTFDGRVDGYTFKTDVYGTGYYLDHPRPIEITAEDIEAKKAARKAAAMAFRTHIAPTGADFREHKG